MCAGAAAHEAGDVAFDELSLSISCSQCRTAAKDDQPLLVRVMVVVRPELLAGIDVVHVSGEELGADPLGDPGLSNAESLVLHFRVARNREHVGDLHIRKATLLASQNVGATTQGSRIAARLPRRLIFMYLGAQSEVHRPRRARLSGMLGHCPRQRTVRKGQYGPRVRLLVARCEVLYTGRLTARLPEAVRLLMFKADGSFLVHDDAGGFRPLNWMTPPTVVEEEGDTIVVRKRAGKSEDRLEVRLLEVLSDTTHGLDATPLEKDGVERHLQEELAAQPDVLGDGLRLVRREWPTDIGPVDLMCRNESGDWIAVEIKRVGTIDAVEQLGRYLERIELDACRGVLAAQTIKPQARTLAESRGIRCVEVDLAVLRGEREPELTLFA
jgi:endonuclease